MQTDAANCGGTFDPEPGAARSWTQEELKHIRTHTHMPFEMIEIWWEERKDKPGSSDMQHYATMWHLYRNLKWNTELPELNSCKRILLPKPQSSVRRTSPQPLMLTSLWRHMKLFSCRLRESKCRWSCRDFSLHQNRPVWIIKVMKMTNQRWNLSGSVCIRQHFSLPAWSMLTLFFAGWLSCHVNITCNNNESL